MEGQMKAVQTKSRINGAVKAVKPTNGKAQQLALIIKFALPGKRVESLWLGNHSALTITKDGDKPQPITLLDSVTWYRKAQAEHWWNDGDQGVALAAWLGMIEASVQKHATIDMAGLKADMDHCHMLEFAAKLKANEDKVLVTVAFDHDKWEQLSIAAGQHNGGSVEAYITEQALQMCETDINSLAYSIRDGKAKIFGCTPGSEFIDVDEVLQKAGKGIKERFAEHVKATGATAEVVFVDVLRQWLDKRGFAKKAA